MTAYVSWLPIFKTRPIPRIQWRISCLHLMNRATSRALNVQCARVQKTQDFSKRPIKLQGDTRSTQLAWVKVIDTNRSKPTFRPPSCHRRHCQNILRALHDRWYGGLQHIALDVRPECLRCCGDTGARLFGHDSSNGGCFSYKLQKRTRWHEVGLQDWWYTVRQGWGTPDEN